MSLKQSRLALTTVFASTLAFASTQQEVRLTAEALQQFHAANPNLVTFDGAPCDLQIQTEVRDDGSWYRIQARLEVPHLEPSIFEISGPRITEVFQSFKALRTPSMFMAVVTNSDSDGYGYWDKDIRTLEIKDDMIALAINDLVESSSKTTFCKVIPSMSLEIDQHFARAFLDF